MEAGDDPYQLLGVAATADYKTIKKNYRQLALKEHPDKGGDPKRFAQIANAYEILSDPPQRHNYDLQQQHGSGNKGYDPKAPQFTSTREDYDPSKPEQQQNQPRGNTPTTFDSSSPRASTTYYDMRPEEWTLNTGRSNNNPSGKTTTYYTTKKTTTKMPNSKRTSTTFQETQHHFVDPMELFRQQFPEAAMHHRMVGGGGGGPTTKTTTSTTTTTSNKMMKSPKVTKAKASTIPVTEQMGGLSMNDHGREVMGMASSTRTVTHPNTGQQELITETVITYADGSSETKRESKFIGMKSPIKMTTTTNTTTAIKPKNMTTTTMMMQSSPTTTNITKKKTTKKSPKQGGLTNTGNKTIVIKNGIPIQTTTTTTTTRTSNGTNTTTKTS